jgi:hypothetical protein
MERDESVEGYHDLSEAIFLCFWTEPFFMPWLSANLASYRGNRLPRPETRDYLSVGAVEGIKDVVSNYMHGINIKNVNGLSLDRIRTYDLAVGGSIPFEGSISQLKYSGLARLL